MLLCSVNKHTKESLLTLRERDSKWRLLCVIKSNVCWALCKSSSRRRILGTFCELWLFCNFVGLCVAVTQFCTLYPFMSKPCCWPASECISVSLHLKNSFQVTIYLSISCLLKKKRFYIWKQTSWLLAAVQNWQSVTSNLMLVGVPLLLGQKKSGLTHPLHHKSFASHLKLAQVNLSQAY